MYAGKAAREVKTVTLEKEGDNDFDGYVEW
jgi:hypothetical protein